MSNKPSISLRIRYHDEARIGPGKVNLLEGIARTGSLQAAGAAMGMSSRRAGLLVDALNKAFDEPVVAPGPAPDGATRLTALGTELVRAYRAAEQKAAEAVAQEFENLHGRLR